MFICSDGFFSDRQWYGYTYHDMPNEAKQQQCHSGMIYTSFQLWKSNSIICPWCDLNDWFKQVLLRATVLPEIFDNEYMYSFHCICLFNTTLTNANSYSLPCCSQWYSLHSLFFISGGIFEAIFISIWKMCYLELC